MVIKTWRGLESVNVSISSFISECFKWVGLVALLLWSSAEERERSVYWKWRISRRRLSFTASFRLWLENCFLSHASAWKSESFLLSQFPFAHTLCSTIKHQLWHFGHVEKGKKLSAGRGTGWEIIPLSCSLCREARKLAVLPKIIRQRISNSWDAKRCNPHFELVARNSSFITTLSSFWIKKGRGSL